MPQPWHGIAHEHLAFIGNKYSAPIIARYSNKHTVQTSHLRRLEKHEFNILKENKKDTSNSPPAVIKKSVKPEGIKPETCEKAV